MCLVCGARVSEEGGRETSSKIVCEGKGMGDFPAPAAAANGSSLCLNNNLSGNLGGGAGLGVTSAAPHGPPPGNSAPHSGGGGTNGSGGGGGGIPKHSTVVERLRQRIEGCRRHHVNCENRYQQAQAEQLELERRDTVSLYQRTLEQRAKKAGTGGGGGSKQHHPSKQPQDAEPAAAEQRNHTLIMVRGREGERGAGGGGRRRRRSTCGLARFPLERLLLA